MRKVWLGLGLLLVAAITVVYLLFIHEWPDGDWAFYRPGGQKVEGQYWPPGPDSATGYAESRPEIPDGDGMTLTRWRSGECTLMLQQGENSLSISRFNGQALQADLHSGKDQNSRHLLDIRMSLPDRPRGGQLNYWTRLEGEQLVGWQWDNVAGRLVPVRYRAADGQLIEGPRYQLTPNSRWQYQRLKDGKTVEQRLLPGELPALPAVISAADQALTAQARQVLRQRVTEMAARLRIAAPPDMLDEKNDPCTTL